MNTAGLAQSWNGLSDETRCRRQPLEAETFGRIGSQSANPGQFLRFSRFNIRSPPVRQAEQPNQDQDDTTSDHQIRQYHIIHGCCFRFRFGRQTCRSLIRGGGTSARADLARELLLAEPAEPRFPDHPCEPTPPCLATRLQPSMLHWRAPSKYRMGYCHRNATT